MKSPFPGMDPYAEGLWPSVHTQMIAGAVVALNTDLPADLAASPEERVEVVSEGGESRAFYPDVKVVGPAAGGGGGAEDEASVAADGSFDAAPVRLLARVEPRTERYIRVVEAATDRLITVIELVSPANKVGEGLADYRGKRAALVEAGVNVVEIDLTRAGNWRALLRPHHCPAGKVTAYRAVVRRADDPGAALLIPIRLDAPMPAVEIPLRSGDAAVRLDLQGLFDRTYAVLKLARRLDYATLPGPALEPRDLAWADDLLLCSGRRPGPAADPA